MSHFACEVQIPCMRRNVLISNDTLNHEFQCIDKTLSSQWSLETLWLILFIYFDLIMSHLITAKHSVVYIGEQNGSATCFIIFPRLVIVTEAILKDLMSNHKVNKEGLNFEHSRMISMLYGKISMLPETIRVDRLNWAAGLKCSLSRRRADHFQWRVDHPQMQFSALVKSRDQLFVSKC